MPEQKDDEQKDDEQKEDAYSDRGSIAAYSVDEIHFKRHFETKDEREEWRKHMQYWFKDRFSPYSLSTYLTDNMIKQAKSELENHPFVPCVHCGKPLTKIGSSRLYKIIRECPCRYCKSGLVERTHIFNNRGENCESCDPLLERLEKFLETKGNLGHIISLLPEPPKPVPEPVHLDVEPGDGVTMKNSRYEPSKQSYIHRDELFPLIVVDIIKVSPAMRETIITYWKKDGVDVEKQYGPYDRAILVINVKSAFMFSEPNKGNVGCRTYPESMVSSVLKNSGFRKRHREGDDELERVEDQEDEENGAEND